MQHARAFATPRIARLLRPPRPPTGPPERIAALSAALEDDSFITGNGFAAKCRFVLNYDELSVNETIENDWWFCKTDWLEYFFRHVAPREPFVLLSHNSDRPIGRGFLRQARRRNLVAWFGTNVTVAHPKVFALPLGIANPYWPHGDAATLEAVRRDRSPKTRLFDAAFRVETNRDERLRCIAETGVEPDAPSGFVEYLTRLASSYFCIAPRGNGIDTHRTWEALYLGTIPVVTRSVLTDQHPDLPVVVLRDWSEFRSVDFSPDLYARLWAAFDTDELRLDRYLIRMSERQAALRS